MAPMWFDMLEEEEEEEEGGASPFPSPLHGWVLAVLFYGPLPLPPTLPRFHPSPYPLSECILWKKAMDPPRFDRIMASASTMSMSARA